VCATAAAAAPEAALYRLTVSGTARATWDHTGPPAATPDCTSSQSAHGARVVSFRSSRPTLVRLEDGRVTPTPIRHLSGRVTAFGQNTANETCAGVETHWPEPCADAPYTFRDAGAVVFSPGRRALSFRAIGMVVQHSECPREPAGVSQLGPLPTFRLSKAALEPQIVRITATASAARRKTYGTPEDGKLVQRSSWKLTLMRVRP
jgi:hypothetical protein